MVSGSKSYRAKVLAEKREEGFTLIELLIVILVLGILAAIVIFALGGVTGQSANAACNTDAKSVETAVAAFQANNGSSVSVTQAALTSTTAPGPYLHSWPNNPGHYAITVATNGTVSVTPNGGTSTPYDSVGTGPNGCSTVS
jgi:general secretion pathway protein G